MWWCGKGWREFTRLSVANRVLIIEDCDLGVCEEVCVLIKTPSQYSSLHFSFLDGPKDGLELPLPDSTSQKNVLILGKATMPPVENIM